MRATTTVAPDLRASGITKWRAFFFSADRSIRFTTVI